MTTDATTDDRWRTRRTDAAAQRILDTAEELYAVHGVDGVTMRALAEAIGCSRATLYRYFPSREAVQAAFVERSARRVARAVANAPAATDPGERLVAAVTTALRLVRGNAAFANWFSPDAPATGAAIAALSPVIDELARGFLRGIDPGMDEPVLAQRSRWLVRVMLSLLGNPGGTVDEEAALLRTFVVPVVVGRDV
ncbi:TetR/AcrR family transcriptional regulator [Gordonia sp. X0973]|uniref:TetR/AcrR family transcriptional regulator n=1 Tax=Gordonia sp. X0973 TaxID=2742602 RepID=UPI000F53BA52|nr:TetR/AcrR family transcriptional regulator [Gordonia sp. X0973]QKT08434.1 TetR/AcrR family transcriptional regulator [Gordonia sp. X0973]